MRDGVAAAPHPPRQFSHRQQRRDDAMPVYEYLCDDCGPFKDMRPMAECDDPQACPQCESMAPRVLLTAENVFFRLTEPRKAHAPNARSTRAPQTLAQYKA